MFKGLVAAFYSLVLLFLGLFAGDAISLSMETSSEVVAGTQFDVAVTIDKGESESFARFSAELPRGLKAVAGSAENAEFRFEGQQVKFVWMRLPNVPKLRISYKVEVDPRLRGSFNLGGELAYIANNARQTAVVAPRTVVITPSPNVELDKQLDLAEYQTAIPAQRDIVLSTLKVRCIREAPPTYLNDGGDYVIRILVNRGEAGKFAKIEEILPAGFTAEPVDTKEAIFSCEDGIVKFLWMTLPAEELFTVSYRLIPEKGAAPGEPKIRGSFSFVQNEATRTIAITQRNVRLQNMTKAQLESLVRESQVVVSRTPEENAAWEGGSIEAQGPSDGGVEFEVKHQDITPMRTRGGGRSSSFSSTRRSASMDNFLLAPEAGVYYRVQVAAGHRPIDINRYFRRLSLHADVRTERHEGWYKYSVGSFKEYKQARDYRVEIWNTTPIRDAFVAAYNNGKRITVQEALMITSQQWYR